MTLVPVSLKVKKEVIEIAEEMVRLGIARSRNHAFNIILEKGMRETRKLIEREKRIREALKLIEKKGGLELEERNAAEELSRMRDRSWNT